MSSRARILWVPLDHPAGLWTRGWLPDSDVLRWSLSAAIRVEGLREGWFECHETAEGATYTHAFVGITDDGDYVECSEWGETQDFEVVMPQKATIALLPLAN